MQGVTMSESALFEKILIGWSALAFLVFAALFFVPAPYGRHREAKRRGIPDGLGWLIMESPAVLVFGILFLTGSQKGSVALVFLLMWMAHYLQRAFIYPFTQRKSRRRMP